MTRGKPLILSREPGSKVRAARKRAAEAAFEASALPRNPPAELAGMKAGRAAWRALLKAHSQLPGELFNGLDRQFLIEFCLAVEAQQRALELEKKLAAKYDAGELVLEVLLKARVELRMAMRLVADLSKQVYATPKARGGVSPAGRQPSPEEVIERELAEIDRLLEDE
jgi:hypothetical protein